MKYLIRKMDKTWKLYHRHQPNGSWHLLAESSYWGNVMWIATGDPTYRMPGYILWPGYCN